MSTHAVVTYRVYPTGYDPCDEWHQREVGTWTVEVQDRGRGWAVAHVGRVLSRSTGNWCHDTRPSERTDADFHHRRFPAADDALAAAHKAVDKVRVGGDTWADVLEWRAASGPSFRVAR